MERHLGAIDTSIPRREVQQLTAEWLGDVPLEAYDPTIIAIESAALAKEYARWHVPELGDLGPTRPDGVFRWLQIQLNSASTEETRELKVEQIKELILEYSAQGVALTELGFCWDTAPASANLASWFSDWRDCKSATAHNAHETFSRRQQGGVGLLAFGALAPYVRKRCPDFRKLGRWCSWLIYADPSHCTRIVVAYNTGDHYPKGTGTIYQQQKRYIQTAGLTTSPRRLFAEDLLMVLSAWRARKERIILFWDANEHVIDGTLSRLIMQRLDMVEVYSASWGATPPHTYIDGSKPIDGCLHTRDVETTSSLLLSFHRSVGDHRTGIIDFTTRSLIGRFTYNRVPPKPRRLTMKNRKSVARYLNRLEDGLTEHRLEERLEELESAAVDYPAPEPVQQGLETLDQQTSELMRHAERRCRKIYRPPKEFSLPVRTWDKRKKCYADLIRRYEGRCHNESNLIRRAWKLGIEHPRNLTLQQLKDGERYCQDRIKAMDGPALRRTHLRNRYIVAEERGATDDVRGIRRVINGEEQRKMWPQINRSVDDPKQGAPAFVQRKEADGRIVDITAKEEMEQEIQRVTEIRFDMAHSAKISLSTLAEKLGYLSDTEFAMQLLSGEVPIPDDLDDTSTLIIEEICRVGMEIVSGTGEKIVLSGEQFRRYWKQVDEFTSSSVISTMHFGHYKAAAQSARVTKFLSRKLTVVARVGCPPSRWGVGLQCLLEKIAGVALVEKLRSILLMEADWSYLNKWAFGYEALNKLAAEGYFLDDQYNLGESTAEDAAMDNRLTFDLSRQLRQVMGAISADAKNCYDAINHIFMSLLLLAITGWIGAIVCMLYPIQTMKFFQRTARGDSTSFFGGPDRFRPLQGLVQGNTAAPGCCSMLFAVLLRCYFHKGFGARIRRPMAGHILHCFGPQFVDDTTLHVWLPEIKSGLELFPEMQASTLCWGTLLCSIGGGCKPEKSYFHVVDYTCDEFGVWDYAEKVNGDLCVPLYDGTLVPIRQLDVDESEEMLGILACPSGNDSDHLQVKVLDRIETWTNRTRNSHLPTKYAWVSYRFKLWAGLRYGLATLATPLSVAAPLLDRSNFFLLSVLGVNRNIKKGWRTIPRAFGGIGLYSFPVEQMICWMNMLIQHFGAPSALGGKFSASLEALQLEIGTAGNPMHANYDLRGQLATPCWWKSVWERAFCFGFRVYLDYPTLKPQRERDRLVVDLFEAAGAEGARLRGLNRCRLARGVIWLSDMTTANGRQLERGMLNPASGDVTASIYTFPRERPSAHDWTEWAIFWAQFTTHGAGLVLEQPLGRWIAPSHRPWRWFFDEDNDILEEVEGTAVHYYHRADGRFTRRGGGNSYRRIRTEANARPSGAPVSVGPLPTAEHVQRLETGPALFVCPTQPSDFWSFLRSWGGAWMWEEVVNERQDLTWLVDALRGGTAIGITDGSYDPKRAPLVSGAGVKLTCTRSKKFLDFSFYEWSPFASAYRGELLGLVALHTLVLAFVEYFALDHASGDFGCDNMGALTQSSKVRKRVKSGAKHADLLRALRTLKGAKTLRFTYNHVASHQDRYKPWWRLTLREQINVCCDRLAKGAVHRSMSGDADRAGRGMQLLPREKAAIFVNNVKLTTDAGDEVRFCLGEKEARAFYTAPNTPQAGGLGWTARRFDQVDWRGLKDCLDKKSDTFGIWLAKQVSGVCATRVNIARIQDLLDDKCPNCEQPGERAGHLNLCPDEGRVGLFNDSVEKLERWLHQDNRTDPELAYWLPKYLLMRGKKPFAELGPMTPTMQRVARSQDEIGWREFTEGRITSEIRAVQNLHCAASPCRMNGDTWVKHFISRVVLISHAQWVFRNFTLYDRQRGYLRLQERKAVLREMEKLIDVRPEEVPEDSRFLLEIDFTSLCRASFEKQSYWVCAMQAARRAGRRTADVRARSGASARQRLDRRRALARRRTVNTEAVERQIFEETQCVSRATRRRVHPSSNDVDNPCNKRHRKPD